MNAISRGNITNREDNIEKSDFISYLTVYMPLVPFFW